MMSSISISRHAARMIYSSNLSKMSATSASFRLRSLSSVVSPQLVKELREKSGAPMMDCKKALAAPEVAGDISKAMDWLRAKGIAKASANASRPAAEGVIAIYQESDGLRLTLLEVNSETDFVGRNRDFHSFVLNVAKTAHHSKQASGEVNIEELLQKQVHEGSLTVKESLGDAVNTIRENIVIRRASSISLGGTENSGFIASYVHNKLSTDFPNLQVGKAAAVAVFSASPALKDIKPEVLSQMHDMGKRLAMHIVAAKPAYLSSAQVPADVIAAEKAIFKEQSSEAGKGKTPDILEKMIQGKVNKRLSEICLLGQQHVAEDGSPVVSKFLSEFSKKTGTELSVGGFSLWTVGQTAEQQ